MIAEPRHKAARALALAYACICLGGMLVHLRLHPPDQSIYYWWAAPTSAFSGLVLPFLFVRPSTVGWACVLNAGTVLIGVVGMGFFSLNTAQGPLTFTGLVMDTTFPYILMVLAKLPLAHGILLLVRPGGPRPPEKGCCP